MARAPGFPGPVLLLSREWAQGTLTDTTGKRASSGGQLRARRAVGMSSALHMSF